MPTGLRTGTDPYALLGVNTAASGDEIARAFRLRAKELHPDTADVVDTTEQFSDLVAAYDLLSNHRTRREYDRTLGESAHRGADGVPATRVGSEPRPAIVVDGPVGRRWTRRTAWIALVAGAVVALLGLGASLLTWQLHQADARRHARFDPVTATRVADGQIMFVTHAGQVVRTREPTQHGEGTTLGPTVAVRYDPSDPQHVVVDASTFGRDITFAIVAVKLLIGGLVFVVLGARRLRMRMPTDAR